MRRAAFGKVRRHRAATVALGVVIGVGLASALTGCAGAGRSETAASSSVATGDTTSSSSLGSGATGTGSPGGGDDAGLTYLPWGPDDPPVPSEYAVLAASPDVAPNCEGAPAAQPGSDFWALAGAVCAAITADGDWPTASSVPAPPPTTSPYQDCLNTELSGLLQGALQWHRDHPGQRPALTFHDAATRSACQDRIYSASVVPAPDPLDDPAPGSVTVDVLYASDSGDSKVTVDGQEVEPDVGSGLVISPLAELLVPVPQEDAPRTATVVVTTAHATLTTAVDVPALDEPQG